MLSIVFRSSGILLQFDEDNPGDPKFSAFSRINIQIKVSRPLPIASIPSRGVTLSLRHIYTTSPSRLPISINAQIKVVHPKPKTPKKPRNPLRPRTGPNDTRTWKDRIGTVKDHVISRLAEEDRDWRLRLNRHHKEPWKNYLHRVYFQDGLNETFGKPSDWLETQNRFCRRYKRPDEADQIRLYKGADRADKAPDSIQSEQGFREISRSERNDWESRDEERREFESEPQQTGSKYTDNSSVDSWRRLRTPERTQVTPIRLAQLPGNTDREQALRENINNQLPERRRRIQQEDSEDNQAIGDFLQKLNEQRAIEALKLEEAAAAAKMSSRPLPPQQDGTARSDLSPISKVQTIPLSPNITPTTTVSENTSSSARNESRNPANINVEGEITSSLPGRPSPPEMNTNPNPNEIGESASSAPAKSSATNSDASPETKIDQVPPAPLPINLGLERITALLEELGNPQDYLKVIQVAGTNGKGSTCAYLTSCLVAAAKRVGQFTSPHLIDRWDGITINNRPIKESEFLRLEREVKSLSEQHNINASSFEILTACALSYFSREKVDLAVIETGMGGTLDATNVFKPENVLVSIITPISLDHMHYLGDTVTEIAKHKAGIIKSHVPVVIAPHPPNVQETLEEAAKSKFAKLVVGRGHWLDERYTRYIVENVEFDGGDPKSLSFVPGIAGIEQGGNVACAVRALSLLDKRGISGISELAVQRGIASASVPGRMEWIRFETEFGEIPVLVDGAHNPASCRALGEFVDQIRRKNPVVWIVGFSEGRDVRSCLSRFVQQGDCLAAVEFGPVDGMPWVRHVDGEEVARQGNVWCQNPEGVRNFGKDLVGAIRWGVQETNARKGMLAATGSLYLVGDIHRLRRQNPDSDSDSE